MPTISKTTAGSRKPLGDVKVADFLAFHLDASKKTRKEIADEIGLGTPQALSMMRNGIMKIPLKSAGRLAKSLGIDPANFARRVMAEYTPDLLEAVEESLGAMVTQNERKVLELWRQATKNTDPAFNTKGQEADFVRAVKDILMA